VGRNGERDERAEGGAVEMRSLNKSAGGGEEELSGLNGNSSDSIYTIKNKWITDW